MVNNITGITDTRKLVLQKTAVKSNTTEAKSSIASVLNQIQSGEQDVNSSGVSLLSKIGNGKTDKTSISQIISSSFNFTSNVAMSQKVEQLLEKTKILLGTKEDSLFLQSRPVTEEARDAFAISCMEDGVDFTLEVKQLAQAQRNEGSELTATDDCGLADGRHYFTLTVDDTVVSLVVRVTAEDTQKTLLDKVVAAINKADVAVTASVVEQDDKVQLMVESNGTGAPLEGKESVFSFGQSGEENIVDYLGMNQIVVAGQNAIFNFNGAEEDATHMYNYALIDDKVNIEFKKVTDGPVSVSFEYDYESLVTAAGEFVTAYNALKEAVADTTYVTISKFFAQVASATKEYKDVLTNIGITIDTEGVMQFNDGIFGATDMKELGTILNTQEGSYTSKVQSALENMNNYMNRLTGKTKKYYGLRAKKSNAALRQLLKK